MIRRNDADPDRKLIMLWVENFGTTSLSVKRKSPKRPRKLQNIVRPFVVQCHTLVIMSICKNIAGLVWFGLMIYYKLFYAKYIFIHTNNSISRNSIWQK